MDQSKFPTNTLTWLKKKDDSYLENAFGSELVSLFKKIYSNDLKHVDNTHTRFVELLWKDLRKLSEINDEAKMIINVITNQWRAERNAFLSPMSSIPKSYVIYEFKELADIEGYPVEKTCPICLEDYLMNDKVANTNCNHNFHEHCIEKQLKCPLCRNVLIPPF